MIMQVFELTARVPHGASARQPKKSDLAERLVVSVSEAPAAVQLQGAFQVCL